MPGSALVRLDRALSKLGLASRAEARELISSGAVTVSGRVVRNPGKLVNPQTATIALGGRSSRPAAWRTIALHKPRGVVTTRRDPEGRRTVFDLLGDAGRGLVTVGRLDMASTGLLLLTTDTQLAAWLTDPANAIVRRYVVTARGNVSDDAVARLTRGIGDLKAHSVHVLKRSNRETHLTIELTEGRNREIRRLLEAVGHEVTRLLRISFGGIELGTLQPGQFRDLPRAAFAHLGVRPGSERGQTGVGAGSERGQSGVRAGSERGRSGVGAGSDPGLTPKRQRELR